MKEDYPEYSEADIRDIYESIELPRRATKGSAGDAFFFFALEPGLTIKVPIGIRAEMEEDWGLKLYPRSGLSFKYRLQLNNMVGIIDSNYFYSDNEGHIMAKIINDFKEAKTVEISAGMGFIQGIFLEYGIIVDDDAEGIRNRGLGSTTK